MASGSSFVDALHGLVTLMPYSGLKMMSILRDQLAVLIKGLIKHLLSIATGLESTFPKLKNQNSIKITKQFLGSSCTQRLESAKKIHVISCLKYSMNKPVLKILFVCMGNICRSPTADGVLKKKISALGLAHQVHIDSAGTHNFHPNSSPDERTQRHALKRGYDLSGLRARAVTDTDFEEFDLLLTMDWDNRALLEERCPAEYQHKIRGFTEFLQSTQATTIPDPYYGGDADFELVLDLVEEACEGLIQTVMKKVST